MPSNSRIVDLADEGDDGAFKIAEDNGHTWEAAMPLGLGIAVVEAEEDK